MEINHNTYGQGIVLSSTETHHRVRFHSGATLDVLKSECHQVLHS